MTYLSGEDIRACPNCKTAANVAGVCVDGARLPLFWECWECGARWHLWREGSRKASQAEHGWKARPLRVKP